MTSSFQEDMERFWALLLFLTASSCPLSFHLRIVVSPVSYISSLIQEKTNICKKTLDSDMTEIFQKELHLLDDSLKLNRVKHCVKLYPQPKSSWIWAGSMPYWSIPITLSWLCSSLLKHWWGILCEAKENYFRAESKIWKELVSVGFLLKIIKKKTSKNDPSISDLLHLTQWMKSQQHPPWFSKSLWTP